MSVLWTGDDLKSQGYGLPEYWPLNVESQPDTRLEMAVDEAESAQERFSI
jgi:hypothetical protein